METEKEKKRQRAEDLLEWYESMAMGAVVLVLLFTFLFRIAVVDGNSMNPTLHNGDRIILRGAAWQPARGDVTVIDAYIGYGKPLCKRIIALGGDTVDIDFDTGEVTVNGTVLREDYIADLTKVDEGVLFPLTVPEGCVFVMGDNRMNSKDSRSPEIGFIDQRDLLGKAVFRLTPLNHMGAIG